VRDDLVADHAAGAGPILDHDGLAEPLLQRLPDDTADDVAPAAGAERHDDANGPMRPFLRGGADDKAEDQRAGGCDRSRWHLFHPSWVKAGPCLTEALTSAANAS